MAPKRSKKRASPREVAVAQEVTSKEAKKLAKCIVLLTVLSGLTAFEFMPQNIVTYISLLLMVLFIYCTYLGFKVARGGKDHGAAKYLAYIQLFSLFALVCTIALFVSMGFKFEETIIKPKTLVTTPPPKENFVGAILMIVLLYLFFGLLSLIELVLAIMVLLR